MLELLAMYDLRPVAILDTPPPRAGMILKPGVISYPGDIVPTLLDVQCGEFERTGPVRDMASDMPVTTP